LLGYHPQALSSNPRLPLALRAMVEERALKEKVPHTTSSLLGSIQQVLRLDII